MVRIDDPQVRLLLYEQLYRATEIRANTKYHK